MKYRTVDAILAHNVPEPLSSGCLRILQENRKLFQTVQGSTNNHQAWPGGYLDHVQEILNIACLLYRPLKGRRTVGFHLSNALVALFFHDIEKPWKYDLGADGQLHHKPGMDTKADQHAFKMGKIAEYGIALTPEIIHAIKYTEGELDDYSGRRRVMSPLAAFCHMCDVWSARGWYEHPLATGDSWEGARRIRD